MKFTFGVAGVPNPHYDRALLALQKLVLFPHELVMEPLARKGGDPRYSQSHQNYFLRKFHDAIESGKKTGLRDRAICLIFVQYPNESTDRFCSEFFPSTFCVPVDWEPTTDERRFVINQSTSELITKVERAIGVSRECVAAVYKEVTDRCNKTPALLPLRNFQSRTLLQAVRDLHIEIRGAESKLGAVQGFVKAVQTSHPMARDDGKFRSCFVDEHGVHYHPPGTARSRHGFAHLAKGHRLSCVLSGHNRLGAPYDPAFHYDCVKEGGKKLVGDFYDCHDPDRAHHEGNPHLNIAPNDFVR